MIDLPHESTPIDFAYAIHTELGNKTAGAKINGKMSSLDTHIQSGDIVEIMQSKTAQPKEKWLDMTKTNMAKRKIKGYLHEHKEAGLFARFVSRIK